MKKTTIAVLMGGQSVEHEVSLLSAQNVISALAKERYYIVPVGVLKNGRWATGDWSEFLVHKHDPTKIALAIALKTTTPLDAIAGVDVVFPLIHGTGGEDGTLQGLLEQFGVAYVGPGVASSAICFDKDFTKRLLAGAGINVAPSLTIERYETVLYNDVRLQLGQVLFVKPARSGSSVGVSKVRNEDGFVKAIETARQFDSKILIEAAVSGRELECAVLGNREVIEASGIGEVKVATDDFYSYENKYLNESGAMVSIPADLSEAEVGRLQEVAIGAFETLGCEGMARVDMFLTPTGEIIVNEVNTIPGFTNISMYPKLWEQSGLSYQALVDRLITLALQRKAAKMSLTHDYTPHGDIVGSGNTNW